ncbi:hypothetical protein HYS82_00705 [Candidatus Amesbacteria bacterium]|nr:hypothetical protein [Candidatus Amesbacteria bacterium]
MKKEKPVSIWEIIEIVQSASDSVKPFAIKFAQKVASMEFKGNPTGNTTQTGEEEINPTDVVTTG